MSEAEERNNRQPDKGKDRPTASFSGSVPGKQIGPFQIERELGRGGMGVVYLEYSA
jgi:hypothetical protein